MKFLLTLALFAALALTQGCATTRQPAAAAPPVGSTAPEPTDAQRIVALENQLRALASKDLRNVRALGGDLVKDMSERLDEYIALTRKSGQSAESDRNITEFGARLAQLKVERAKLDAERAQVAAEVQKEIQRNKARFDSGELVCANPTHSSTARFSRVTPYTGDWMVFYCDAKPASAISRMAPGARRD